MARDSGVSPNAPHVSLTGGGAVEKGLGGHERDEGVALLVTDTGRADFSGTTHPQLTVGTTAVSLNTVHGDNIEVSAKRGFRKKSVQFALTLILMSISKCSLWLNESAVCVFEMSL